MQATGHNCPTSLARLSSPGSPKRPPNHLKPERCGTPGCQTGRASDAFESGFRAGSRDTLNHGWDRLAGFARAAGVVSAEGQNESGNRRAEQGAREYV